LSVGFSEESMKISISEARRRLPELVRRLRKGGGAPVQITVHEEVVAELRAVQPEPEPGAAARKLLDLMRRLPKHHGRKASISSQLKKHLHESARGGR
jgi:antitoxin (DNA-binding transcriptional repressor) of toxin-antitoxin stability system